MSHNEIDYENVHEIARVLATVYTWSNQTPTSEMQCNYCTRVRT